MFDNVEVEFVVEGVRVLNFPMLDLVLGLHMRLAKICLQHSSCVSVTIQPYRSILPGCALAIAFTKALLKPKLQPLVDEHPEVQQTIYVDGFA